MQKINCISAEQDLTWPKAPSQELDCMGRLQQCKLFTSKKLFLAEKHHSSFTLGSFNPNNWSNPQSKCPVQDLLPPAQSYSPPNRNKYSTSDLSTCSFISKNKLAFLVDFLFQKGNKKRWTIRRGAVDSGHLLEQYWFYSTNPFFLLLLDLMLHFGQTERKNSVHSKFMQKYNLPSLDHPGLTGKCQLLISAGRMSKGELQEHSAAKLWVLTPLFNILHSSLI